MKNVYMMITEWCPHCKRAKNWMEELKQEHLEFQKVNVEIIDEEKQEELLKQHNFNYYYVPTYYVGGEKVHEGVPTKEIIQKVFEKALAE